MLNRMEPTSPTTFHSSSSSSSIMSPEFRPISKKGHFQDSLAPKDNHQSGVETIIEGGKPTIEFYDDQGNEILSLRENQLQGNGGTKSRTSGSLSGMVLQVDCSTPKVNSLLGNKKNPRTQYTRRGSVTKYSFQ